VRGPARVADADAARRGPVPQVPGQVLDPAGALAQVQPAAGERRQAGAIVAPVLQAAQPLDEEGFRLAAADVADDSAHGQPQAFQIRQAPGLTPSVALRVSTTARECCTIQS